MSFELRRWQRDDAAVLAEIYSTADPALLSNIPDDRSLNGARSWIESITDAEAGQTTRAFAIVERGAGIDGDKTVVERSAEAENSERSAEAATSERILGTVMASGIDRRHSSAWISYWTVAEARGRGLASAALRSLVDHLHDELDVYRLELGYRTNNPASAAVARSAGFLVEGCEREKLLYDGVRFDTETAARLAGDPRGTGRRLSLTSLDDDDATGCR